MQHTVENVVVKGYEDSGFSLNWIYIAVVIVALFLIIVWGLKNKPFLKEAYSYLIRALAFIWKNRISVFFLLLILFGISYCENNKSLKAQINGLKISIDSLSTSYKTQEKDIRKKYRDTIQTYKDSMKFLHDSINDIRGAKNIAQDSVKELKRINARLITRNNQLARLFESRITHNREAFQDSLRAVLIKYESPEGNYQHNIKSEREKAVNKAVDSIMKDFEVNSSRATYFFVEPRSNGYNKEDGKPDRDNRTEKNLKASKILEIYIDFILNRNKEKKDWYYIKIFNNNNEQLSNNAYEVIINGSNGERKINFRKGTLMSGELIVILYNKGNEVCRKTIVLSD
jgi:hypothetical protein